jgi:hypothetical protein
VGSIKSWKVVEVAAQLAAPQEGLSSMSKFPPHGFWQEMDLLNTNEKHTSVYTSLYLPPTLLLLIIPSFSCSPLFDVLLLLPRSTVVADTVTRSAYAPAYVLAVGNNASENF